MTVASEITRIEGNIEAAYTAASAKGATLPATENSDNLATCIGTITGSSPVITSLSVTPTTSAQTITAPSGTDGYSPVLVAAVTSSIDANITAGNIKDGVTILGVTGSYTGGGGSGGTTDVPLTRFKDDTNTEIGTHFCNFQDGNGNTYKVILLDAQYRLDNTQWSSTTAHVTNMNSYGNVVTSSVWSSTETATTNTQLILDWCSANSYTSTACTHCRSKSFTIGGTTYYGQLPNFIETLYIGKHYNEFDALDTSSSSYTSLNFSEFRRVLTSIQSSATMCLYMTTTGIPTSILKTQTSFFSAPVLEIPNAVS